MDASFAALRTAGFVHGSVEPSPWRPGKPAVAAAAPAASAPGLRHRFLEAACAPGGAGRLVFLLRQLPREAVASLLEDPACLAALERLALQGPASGLRAVPPGAAASAEPTWPASARPANPVPRLHARIRPMPVPATPAASLPWETPGTPTSLGDLGPRPLCSAGTMTAPFSEAQFHREAARALGPVDAPAERAAVWRRVAARPAEERCRAARAWMGRALWRLAPEEDALYARFRLELLGVGGTQAVYGSPLHPDRVFKVDIAQIRTHIAYNLQFPGRPLHAAPPGLREALREAVHRERSCRPPLTRHFAGHVLPEHLEVASLPVPGRIAAQIGRELIEARDGSAGEADFSDGMQGCHRMPTLLRTQRRTDLYDRPGLLDLQSSFAEKMAPTPPLDLDAYALANRLWVQGLELGSRRFDPGLYLAVQSTRRGALDALLAAADRDPKGLHPPLEHCAVHAAHYSNETQMHLELAGQRNLLFYPTTGGRWNYMLVDAQYAAAVPVLRYAPRIVRMIANGGVPTRPQASLLLNALNYTRTVNGLLHYLGRADERVRWPGPPLPASTPWPRIYEVLRWRSAPRPPHVITWIERPTWRAPLWVAAA